MGGIAHAPVKSVFEELLMAPMMNIINSKSFNNITKGQKLLQCQ
jgi:hypothetical protein